MSINKVILIGRLGAKPEIKNTPSGVSVTNFNIATNESWVDKNSQKQERTEWHRIVVWGKLAQLCAEYLDKGRQVFVEGRLQTRQWQDKDGATKYTTEVVASGVQFLDRGTSPSMGAGASSGYSASPGRTADVAMEEPAFSEDDIPF